MSENRTTLLPDALLGHGVYKLGYVTTDREAAIERFQDELGIEEFVRFEPSFEARAADGRTGAARLRCAFSAGRGLLVEVLEPVEGLVDIFREPLAGADGFKVAFHHYGVLVDDLDAVKDSIAARGGVPALVSSPDSPVAFTFTELPVARHYVEHYHRTEGTMGLIDRVRNQVSVP